MKIETSGIDHPISVSIAKAERYIIISISSESDRYGFDATYMPDYSFVIYRGANHRGTIKLIPEDDVEAALLREPHYYSRDKETEQFLFIETLDAMHHKVYTNDQDLMTSWQDIGIKLIQEENGFISLGEQYL